MDSGDVSGFVLEMIHQETSELLRIVDEICQRYPLATDLLFVRYLLRMIVLESERGKRRHRR